MNEDSKKNLAISGLIAAASIPLSDQLSDQLSAMYATRNYPKGVRKELIREMKKSPNLPPKLDKYLRRFTNQDGKDVLNFFKNRNRNRLLSAFGVGGGVAAASHRLLKGKEKTAGALRARTIESLIGAAGGAAGGAYAEKKERPIDEYGQEYTNKDRKLKYIGGGALAGTLGIGAASKLSRILKKRRLKKDYKYSLGELEKVVQESKDDLKSSGLSPLRLKKKRRVEEGERLLRKFKDNQDKDLNEAYKSVDGSVFGRKRRNAKADKDFFRNFIQATSRAKDSL